MRPPCSGCPDRRVGCHGSCEKYQAFNAERELIRERRSSEGDIYQAHVSAMRRINNSRRYINPKKLR